MSKLNPIAAIRRKFTKATAPALALPLVLLFFIYFADEFDTSAFSTLAPEIKKTFHLTNAGFTRLVGINVVIIILLAIPLGWWADRTNRVRLSFVSAVVAVVFSFLTGIAPTVALLVLVRLGNGLGLLANDPVHRSLLTDYYPRDNRPEVFSIHATAPAIGAIAGPAAAGLIGHYLGWRPAFFIMAIPILVVTVFLLRLREPVRGASDSPDEALEAALEKPVKFGRAVRILYTVKTLRRQFLAAFFLGAAYIPLVTFLVLYLDQVFHVGEVGRGFIGAVNAAGALVGILVSGKLTRERWLKKGLGVPQKMAGYIILTIAIGLLLISSFARIWLVVPVGVIVSAIGAMYFPPILTTSALVAPARIRSQAFTFSALFLAAGAVFGLIISGGISDKSVRLGIASLTPWWIIAGLVIWSSHRFVEEDAGRALMNLFTTAQLRRERLESSERSVLVCRGVDVSYGPVQVLFGVDLEMKEGEMIALLGTNGAGKSTLLKAISGLVPCSAGAIFFDGEDITGMEPEDTFHVGVVQVPGGRGIFPGLTVDENLRIAAWATRRPKSELEPAIARIYETFPALVNRRTQPASVLSGGEQQMLTLGQAFIAKPKLLMIDELSLGLAPIIIEQLLEIVQAIHDEGTSVILVEQSVNVALTVADRAYFMEKGEIRFSGPTNELLGRDDILRAVFLGGEKVLAPVGSET